MTKQAEGHKELSGKLLSFLHKNVQKPLNATVEELNQIEGVNFNFEFYSGDTQKQLKKKMKKIDNDFEHCISTAILSKAEINRQKKRHLIKTLKKPVDIPKGASIDVFSLSLNRLRRMSEMGSKIFSGSETISFVKTPSTRKGRGVYLTNPTKSKRKRANMSQFHLPFLSSKRKRAKTRKNSQIIIKDFRGKKGNFDVFKSSRRLFKPVVKKRMVKHGPTRSHGNLSLVKLQLDTKKGHRRAKSKLI